MTTKGRNWALRGFETEIFIIKKNKYPTYHKQGIFQSFTNFSTNYDLFIIYSMFEEHCVCNTNITTFNRNNQMSLRFFYFSFYHINKNLVSFKPAKNFRRQNLIHPPKTPVCNSFSGTFYCILPFTYHGRYSSFKDNCNCQWANPVI